MIQNLKVNNFVLIDSLSIDLQKGFSVFTGETGSGKSIMLGALGLLLGKRAETDSLLDKEKKCVVEGTFVAHLSVIKSLFKENDLDYFDGEIIIRREIHSNGRSRAFVNDSPVNLGLLKEIGEHLVDIHSQHQTLKLNDLVFQYNVLDSFLPSLSNKENYQKTFKTYKKIQKELKSLKEQFESQNTEQDYQEFLLNELVEADLKLGELKQLENDLKVHSSSEEILNTLSQIQYSFQESEQSVLSIIGEISAKLNNISEVDEELSGLNKTLNNAYIELQEFVRDVDAKNGKVQVEPGMLQQIEERLNTYYTLMRKHNCNDDEELYQLKEELEQKAVGSENLETKIKELENELAQLESSLNKISDSLSKQRVDVAKTIGKRVNDGLKYLSMPEAEFSIPVKKATEFNTYGKDEIQFSFTPNKLKEASDISKVASGGELSRVAFVIKSLLGSKVEMPTLIFDEIDTGVSGEVALQMGNVMKQMGDKMQLISITHLPQVAGKGNHHFKVAKASGKTTIKPLTQEERVLELAEILSGKNPSKAAKENARLLLK